MRKAIIAAVLCMSLLSCLAVCTVASADNGSPFPQSLSYEYSGESTVLPVYPSDGSYSFAVTVMDASETVLAENVVQYTFDVGEYRLEYVVYANNNITQPAGTYYVSVTVRDTTAPTITVSGGFAQNYTEGAEISLPNATANDLHDGNIECSVSVTKDGKSVTVQDGKITAQIGEYIVAYCATDSFGNTARREYSFTVLSENGAATSKKKGCGYGAMVAGITIGGLCVLGACAAIIVIVVKRRKTHAK